MPPELFGAGTLNRPEFDEVSEEFELEEGELDEDEGGDEGAEGDDDGVELGDDEGTTNRSSARPVVELIARPRQERIIVRLKAGPRKVFRSLFMEVRGENF
jgi:hypothetical protein